MFRRRDEDDGRNDARVAHARPIVAESPVELPCGQMLPRRRDRAGTRRWRSLTPTRRHCLPAPPAARLRICRPIWGKFGAQSGAKLPPTASSSPVPCATTTTESSTAHKAQRAELRIAQAGRSPRAAFGLKVPAGSARLGAGPRLGRCQGRKESRDSECEIAKEVGDEDEKLAGPQRKVRQGRPIPSPAEHRTTSTSKNCET